MIYPFQHIVNLAKILYQQGVEDIVISPGSRNAPLVNVFYKQFGTKCKSIVDERSAAYYALGRSLFTKKPTVIICTSGTAALNYSPAVAEAFYQAIPLIVLTADRPSELIGQQDNQTIFQNNIYGLNIKRSFTFPDKLESDEDILTSDKITTEAFLLTVSERHGPVHINIPLREPLYIDLPGISKNIRVKKKESGASELSLPHNFSDDWKVAKSIMVVCGQMQPDEQLFNAISEVKNDSRVIIVAEAISNLHQIAHVSSPDILFDGNKNPAECLPELVIYFGGQVVSKELKIFLRNIKTSNFYFLENSDREVDTFQNLKSAVRIEPDKVFRLLPIQKESVSEYKKNWQNKYQSKREKARVFVQDAPFSDLKVFEQISQALPDDTILFSGNSSTVRYFQYFNQKEREFYANRGTSGIDGSLSTAVGYASATDKPVFAVLGDLSFLYDSNALWNKEFPSNLKIIVVNNNGGGIFHLIDGPNRLDTFYPYIEAHHPVKIDKLADAFGISYYFCNNIVSLKENIGRLINLAGSCILEVKTPKNGMPEITKNLFKSLNK